MKKTLARAFSPSLLPSFSLSSFSTIVPQVTVYESCRLPMRVRCFVTEIWSAGSGFFSVLSVSVFSVAVVSAIEVHGAWRNGDATRRYAAMKSQHRIPAGVWVLGFVSLLMDISSEMIHSLLPLYLTVGLGASALTVGIIEGIAESTALIVKV